jgi:KGK domain
MKFANWQKKATKLFHKSIDMNPNPEITLNSKLVERNDVIHLIDSADRMTINQDTFLVDEFINQLRVQIQRSNHLNGSQDIRHKWFVSGVECHVLSPHNGWQSGKLKIRLEFTADEEEEEEEDSSEESPLDEIRKMAKEGE